MLSVIKTLAVEKECAFQLFQPAEDFVRRDSSVCVEGVSTDAKSRHVLTTQCVKMENVFLLCR